jgi:putative flippase GtrA
MKTTATFWFLLRYGIVGAVGGALQTLTLFVWVSTLHLETLYLFGAGVGFCVALTVTFALQKYWTFRDHSRTETRRQFLIYTGIALLNLGLNVLLLHMSKLSLERAGLDFFDTWYVVAQIAIIVFLAAASFAANYLITFRTSPPVGGTLQIVPDERA